MSTEVDELRERAVLSRKGNRFEDMRIGELFIHHWGRTINAADTTQFTTQTAAFCPLYLNEPYACALGHPGLVVNPLLVFNMVFGISVEDLSEGGGPFLGVDACEFVQPVYVGDTLTAKSEVMAKRESRGQKNMGIVTWATRGFNQQDELIIEFQRTNLVRKRAG